MCSAQMLAVAIINHRAHLSIHIHQLDTNLPHFYTTLKCACTSTRFSTFHFLSVSVVRSIFGVCAGCALHPLNLIIYFKSENSKERCLLHSEFYFFFQLCKQICCCARAGGKLLPGGKPNDFHSGKLLQKRMKNEKSKSVFMCTHTHWHVFLFTSLSSN